MGELLDRPRRGWLTLLLLLAACAGTPYDPWPRVRGSGDAERLRRYAADYPDSPHVDEALALAQTLIEERDREAAREDGSRAALEQYVARHPGGSWAEEARAEIERLLDDEAWEVAAEADTRVAFETYLDGRPEGNHAPQARAQVDRFDEDDEVERARASDDLAAWEAFVRARPDSRYREEAGRRIEALLPSASEEVRTEIDRIVTRITPLEEEDGDEERDPDERVFSVVEMALAPAGETDMLLVKGPDYSYLSIRDIGDEPTPEAAAFEEPSLRFLEPLRVCVLWLSEETLFSDDATIDQKQTNLFFRMSKLAEVDFMDTRLYTCWPRDVDAFKPEPGDTRQVHTQRGFVGNLLSERQLLENLHRLQDHNLAWGAARVRAAGVEPTNDFEAVTLHLAGGDDDALLTLGTRAAESLQTHLTGKSALLAHRATHGLLLLDPSGARLNALEQDAGAVAGERLVELLLETPELAGELSREGRSGQAIANARQRLEADFQGEGNAARTASRKLPHLDWDPELPLHAVRTLAIHDRWDEIQELGQAAIVPLLVMLRTVSDERRYRVEQRIELLVESHGPQPQASELLREDPLLRRRVLLGPGARAYERVFEGDAAAYLIAARAAGEESKRMGDLAERATDSGWSTLAAEWVSDAEPRPLDELVAEGKVEWEARGSGIRHVILSLTNRTDHRLRVDVPVGTRFVASSSSVQNMVATRTSRAFLDPGATESHEAPVACANLERDIPGSSTTFQLDRVEPNSELDRLLQAFNSHEEPAVRDSAGDEWVAQAAVWIVTDDPSYNELSNLVEVSGPGRSSRSLIGVRTVLSALKVLDATGIDVREKRVWRNMPALMDSYRNWHDPWYEEMRAEDEGR